jgi:hypothetical protein
MNSINEPDPVFGEAAFCYTRAQALADGVLVYTGELAQEAGFLFSVGTHAWLYKKRIARGTRVARRGLRNCDASKVTSVAAPTPIVTG